MKKQKSVSDVEECKEEKLTRCPERLSKDWDAPTYAFYRPLPIVTYIKGRRVHQF